MSNMKHTDISEEEGFTLVEILVALIILSSIGVIVSGFIGQLGQLNKKTDEMVVQQNSTMALSYLSKTIAGAQNIPLEFSTNGQIHIFRGALDWLEFVGPVRIRSNTYALRHIKFDLDNERQQIRQSTSPILSKVESGEPGTVIFGIASKSLKLRFHYKSKDGVWLDEWNKRGALPLAVKIGIYPTLPDGKVLEAVTALQNSTPHIIQR